MALYPPFGPYLINIELFGFPIAVRWYGVLIMSGALLAAWLSGRRAESRGFDPEHIWNQLMLGLIMGIVGARIYYVAFEWDRFADNPISALNLTTGGLAIHGGLIGAVAAAVIYTRRHRLPFWEWLDICIPGFLLAQSIGRWGNFTNQEAYGIPTTLGFGVRIDQAHRLPPFHTMELYPPDTLFHPTFLYESLWNLVGVGLLLLLERQFGRSAPKERRWLRSGDLFFCYAIYYSLGRVWIEGLRIDNLYLGEIRIAQLMSLTLILVGIVGVVLNHRRTIHAPEEEVNAAGGTPNHSPTTTFESSEFSD